jgi:putative membrane protein
MNKLSDGQIAEVLATVDGAEIEQAQVALQKSTNTGVREFAQHMVDEHTASKQAGAELASRNSLTLASSPKSTTVRATGGEMLGKMKAADVSTFDATYIQAQIDQHSEVLQMIDDQLLPAVVNPELRTFVSNARGMVERHLHQAQQLEQ